MPTEITSFEIKKLNDGLSSDIVYYTLNDGLTVEDHSGFLFHNAYNDEIEIMPNVYSNEKHIKIFKDWILKHGIQCKKSRFYIDGIVINKNDKDKLFALIKIYGG